MRAEVTEHRLIERECGGCGALTKGKAPDGVAAPVQYRPRAAALGVYLWHGQFLSRDRACAAMADMFGCTPSPGALAAMAKKTAGAIAPALDAIITALIESEVAHFDETGFRVAGKLAVEGEPVDDGGAQRPRLVLSLARFGFTLYVHHARTDPDHPA